MRKLEYLVVQVRIGIASK